ncbi:MAG: hypothetical protein ACTHL3_06085, partial [Candidatus Nitrosocosmicus sp.]
MHFIDKNVLELPAGMDNYRYVEKVFSRFFINKSQTTSNDKNNSDIDDNDKADINTREKEHIKDVQKYQQYQENQQDQQPWSDS